MPSQPWVRPMNTTPKHVLICIVLPPNRSGNNGFQACRQVRRTHAISMAHKKRLRTTCSSGTRIFFSFRSILMTSLKLLTALSSIQSQWSAQVFTGTYIDAKDQSAEFTTYKQTTKRTWVAEKQDLATLFGNVQTKLRTYGLREYSPPPGLALSDLDAAWKMLLEKEAERSRKINAQIRQ